MRSKSMKMVFVARIIRHKLCMIYAFLDFFVQKSFLTKNFLTADINLTTRGPLYTCLVVFEILAYVSLIVKLFLKLLLSGKIRNIIPARVYSPLVTSISKCLSENLLRPFIFSAPLLHTFMINITQTFWHFI